MAEANARREARMRRILENSENRLKKITNRVTLIDNEETITSINKISPCLSHSNDVEQLDDELSQETFSPNINGIMPVVRNDRLDDSPEKMNGRLKFDHHHNFDTEYSEPSRMPGPSDSHRIMNEQTVTPSILQNRANYVILAVIVNVLLLLKLDHLFGKAILIPCFTMIIARLYTCRNAQESSKGNLFIAALILCYVRPELTYNIKRSMSLIALVLHDLALYIFSFVLVYYGASYCKVYFNPNELDCENGKA